MKSEETIKSLLKESGLKTTKARLSILHQLMSQHHALTVEELFEGLEEQGTDLSTVYRSTEALENANIISRVDFQDGFIRYEYNPEGKSHHHHVVCRRCGKRQCVNLCVQKSWKNELQSIGYREVSHRLEFFGLCPNCAD